MTNLEFINKKIEDCKERIKYWKEKLIKYPDNEVFTICLNKTKEELQTLQQIKTDLEAWGIVKRIIDVSYNGFDDSYYVVPKAPPIIFHKEQFKPVIKALEVEDENNT